MADDVKEQEGLEPGEVSIEDLDEDFFKDEEDDEGGEKELPPDVNTLTVGDEDETLKGLTVGAVVERVKNLQRALKVSEDARLAATKPPPPPPTAPPPELPKELTDEEIVQLMQEDGVKALQVIREQMGRRLDAHLERRLGPLGDSTVVMARAEAERKYPLEFKLFGNQINDMVSGLKDRAILADPAQWKNVVEWVRGQEGNIDKFVEARAAESGIARGTAQEMQRESAGVSARPTRGGGGGAGGSGNDYGLDDTQKEIARNLMPGAKPEVAYREYKKWM